MTRHDYFRRERAGVCTASTFVYSVPESSSRLRTFPSGCTQPVQMARRDHASRSTPLPRTCFFLLFSCATQCWLARFYHRGCNDTGSSKWSFKNWRTAEVHVLVEISLRSYSQRDSPAHLGYNKPRKAAPSVRHTHDIHALTSKSLKDSRSEQGRRNARSILETCHSPLRREPVNRSRKWAPRVAHQGDSGVSSGKFNRGPRWPAVEMHAEGHARLPK